MYNIAPCIILPPATICLYKSTKGQSYTDKMLTVQCMIVAYKSKAKLPHGRLIVLFINSNLNINFNGNVNSNTNLKPSPHTDPNS